MKVYNVVGIEDEVCNEGGLVKDLIDSGIDKDKLIKSYGCNIDLLEEEDKKKMELLLEEGVIDMDLDCLDELSCEEIEDGDWEDKLYDIDDWWFIKLIEKEY